MEPLRPSAEAHVSPGSLGIDERHGRRGFVKTNALNRVVFSRLASLIRSVFVIRLLHVGKVPARVCRETRVVAVIYIPPWLVLGLNRDSNLVDSASSIRLSQRLSHACLSINKSIL